MKKIRTSFFISLLILTVFSCSKDKVFQSGEGAIQQKPASKVDTQNAAPQGTTEPTLVVKGVYKLSITGTETTLTPCEGEIQLNIMSDMQAQLAKGELTCLGIPIPIQKFLPPLPKVEAEVTQKVESDGRVFRGAKIGDYAFKPARPFLVGPVIQDISKFVNYQESKEYEATREKDGETETYNGNISLNILETEAKYLEVPGEPLEHVIKWEMKSTGFENIDHGASFCFYRYEMWWSTNPLAIARLEINDSGAEFTGGALPSSAKKVVSFFDSIGEKFGGKIKVLLELKEIERPK